MLLGWILTVVGLLFILLGFVGAVRDIFLKPKAQQANWMDWIQAITELIKALTAAPQWLALVVVGVGLVYWGQHLVSVKG
jgi:uncharacterized membrane protein